ncbi:sigma-54-dependent transcriptional regulator, partial [Acidobacteriota bacterium]
MEKFSILIVDDEETLRDALHNALSQVSNHEYFFAGDGVEAMEIIESHPINLVLTDLHMPRMNGEELLETVKKHNPEIPIIIITSFGTIDNAVDLLRRGAYDYITKPFKIAELMGRIERALERLTLIGEIKTLRSRLQKGAALSQIIGRSGVILGILKKLPSIARSDASVIIYGESGTGKELVARAVHTLSPRSQKPFVPVDCGALPESLLENELFGHMKGAFTDAYRNHIGLIQEADTGTMFLDEIGEISLSVQAKLLRFLQEKEIKPLGSNRQIKINVRIVSATNKILAKAIAQGSFREDLYYRLNIIPIHLPA